MINTYINKQSIIRSLYRCKKSGLKIGTPSSDRQSECRFCFWGYPSFCSRYCRYHLKQEIYQCFFFEKFFHRLCVIYGKSKNRMPQVITIPRAYGFQNFDTMFPSNAGIFQRYCKIICKSGRNRTNEGKIYKFQFFPSLFGISYDFFLEFQIFVLFFGISYVLEPTADGL